MCSFPSVTGLWGGFTWHYTVLPHSASNREQQPFFSDLIPEKNPHLSGARKITRAQSSVTAITKEPRWNSSQRGAEQKVRVYFIELLLVFWLLVIIKVYMEVFPGKIGNTSIPNKSTTSLPCWGRANSCAHIGPPLLAHTCFTNISSLYLPRSYVCLISISTQDNSSKVEVECALVRK